MNVYRITFEEFLDSKSEPHPDDPTTCGEDTALIVANGDCLEAAMKFAKSRVGRDASWTDEETGKEMLDFVASCNIHGIERLHTDVEILK